MYQAVTGRDPLEGTSLDVSPLYAAAPPAAAGDLAVTVDTTTPRDRKGLPTNVQQIAWILAAYDLVILRLICISARTRALGFLLHVDF